MSFLVVRGAMDRATCEALRREMDAAPKAPSTIARSCDVVDESLRKTRRARVGAGVVAEITAFLEARRESLASQLGRTVSSLEEPQFLVYDEGGHFQPHLDTVDDRALPLHVQKRRISVVLFLGGAHEGGDLVLYGVFDDPRAKAIGLPFSAAEEGTLVAFRADLLHEVQRVVSGRRYTIAAWFAE